MSKLALKNSKLKETEASLQQETVRLTRDLQEERRGDLEKLAQANKSLEAAKAFLTTPDEVPKCQEILDAFDLTRVPNSILFQENVDNGDGPTGLTWVPTPLAKLFRFFDPEQDTSDQWDSVMQMAAQPGIVRYEKHLLSTWDFAMRGTRPFETLCEAVGRMEPHPWRALIQGCLRSRVPLEPQQFVDEFTVIVVEILVAAGVEESSEDVMSVFADSFGGDFRRIVDNTLKFQRICGEQIISIKLALEDIPAGDKFDRSRMVEEEVDLRMYSMAAKPRDYVLCTTPLGYLVHEWLACAGDLHQGKNRSLHWKIGDTAVPCATPSRAIEAGLGPKLPNDSFLY